MFFSYGNSVRKLWGKCTKDIVQKVKDFKLSNKITTHRTQDLSNNIKDKFEIKKSQ